MINKPQIVVSGYTSKDSRYRSIYNWNRWPTGWLRYLFSNNISPEIVDYSNCRSAISNYFIRAAMKRVTFTIFSLRPFYVPSPRALYECNINSAYIFTDNVMFLCRSRYTCSLVPSYEFTCNVRRSCPGNSRNRRMGIEWKPAISALLVNHC